MRTSCGGETAGQDRRGEDCSSHERSWIEREASVCAPPNAEAQLRANQIEAPPEAAQRRRSPDS